MACCKCCCGNVDCAEGDQGKCCCGGSSGTCCQEGEYCCSGVCQATPCCGGAYAGCPGFTYIAVTFDVPHSGPGWDYANLQWPGFHSSISMFGGVAGTPGPYNGSSYAYENDCPNNTGAAGYVQSQNGYSSRETAWINPLVFVDRCPGASVTALLNAHWRDGWPGSGPITISVSCGSGYQEIEVTPPTGGTGCPSSAVASLVMFPDATFTLSANPLP